MSLAHRLHQLERRTPRPAAPYCVVVQPAETEADAIARTRPGRGYFLVPAPMQSIEGWATEAEKVLSR